MNYRKPLVPALPGARQGDDASMTLTIGRTTYDAVGKLADVVLEFPFSEAVALPADGTPTRH